MTPLVLGPLAALLLPPVTDRAAVDTRHVAKLVETLQNGPWFERYEAIDSLARLGPRAKVAIPALLAILREARGNLACQAAKAVARIDPDSKEGATAMLQVFRRPSWWISYADLMEPLGGMCAASTTVRACVAAALKDEDKGLRTGAAAALARAGMETESAFRVLTELLKDGAAEVRSGAIAVLFRLGPKAEPVCLALADALKDPDELNRVHAATALGTIGPEAQPAVPVLRQALQDRAKRVRYGAAEALVKICRDESALPILIAQLNERNWGGRLWGACQLGKLAFRPLMVGRIDDEAHLELLYLQTLMNAQETGAWSERQQAAASLGQLGSAARSAVPALIEALGDSEDLVRWQAGQALLQVVAPAPDARRALEAALRGKGPGVREAVKRVLESIEVPDEVRQLIKALQDPDPVKRDGAAKALGKLGPRAKAAVPALIERLQIDPVGEVRFAAAEALGKIGADAKPAVPTLREALKDEDRLVRVFVAESLVMLDPDSQEVAVAALVEALRYSKTEPAEVPPFMVYRSLGRLGPRARSAQAAVIARLREGDPMERILALGVLGAMKADDPALVPVLVTILEKRDLGLLVPALTRGGGLLLTPLLSGRIQDARAGIGALLECEDLARLNLLTRLNAIDVLAGIGPKAAAAIPALEEAGNDHSLSIRQAARDALEKVRGKP